ncbi:hypothetical protein BK025_11605 [Sodalis sp. TME1]|nr:hypothetical protein BK025_11605 [Sodalis sp. TME1]
MIWLITENIGVIELLYLVAVIYRHGVTFFCHEFGNLPVVDRIAARTNHQRLGNGGIFPVFIFQINLYLIFRY